jgi:hypothetical protein
MATYLDGMEGGKHNSDETECRPKTKKKIYRTVFRFEVLSEEPIEESMSLEDIAYETQEGHMSGHFLENQVTNEVLVGGAAVKATKAQGSDPSFFMMDDKGFEID